MDFAGANINHPHHEYALAPRWPGFVAPPPPSPQQQHHHHHHHHQVGIVPSLALQCPSSSVGRVRFSLWEGTARVDARPVGEPRVLMEPLGAHSKILTPEFGFDPFSPFEDVEVHVALFRKTRAHPPPPYLPHHHHRTLYAGQQHHHHHEPVYAASPHPPADTNGQWNAHVHPESPSFQPAPWKPHEAPLAYSIATTIAPSPTTPVPHTPVIRPQQQQQQQHQLSEIAAESNDGNTDPIDAAAEKPPRKRGRHCGPDASPDEAPVVRTSSTRIKCTQLDCALTANALCTHLRCKAHCCGMQTRDPSAARCAIFGHVVRGGAPVQRPTCSYSTCKKIIAAGCENRSCAAHCLGTQLKDRIEGTRDGICRVHPFRPRHPAESAGTSSEDEPSPLFTGGGSQGM